MELKNKIVLLTGASTGMGKAMAEAFLKRKSKVIVFGRNKPRYCSLFYEVDVSDENQIVRALSKIKKIDVLINNAGISKDSEVAKTPSGMLDTMIDVNFKGAYWMAKHSSKKLNRGGCIINISSICGLHGFADMGVYSATKAAIINLTQTLALELASRKIRSNAIAPGVIETDIWKKRFGAEGRKIMKQIEATIPLKRGGKPEEIAHVAVFLCENEFINGETIVVDGGQTIAG